MVKMTVSDLWRSYIVVFKQLICSVPLSVTFPRPIKGGLNFNLSGLVRDHVFSMGGFCNFLA